MRKALLLAAVITLLPLTTARAEGNKVLSFETMYGVDGPFLNDSSIRGVQGDELPWDIRKAKGTLSVDGHLVIQIKGLVFSNDPSVPPNLRGTNDETSFRALVSCLVENGNQIGTLHHGHWFKKPVSAYVVPGKPDSGLVAGVSAEPPGVKGEADHRLQAYCYRMCLTNAPENRIPFPKPEGYDPKQYELAVRVFEGGWREHFGKFDPIPNHKTDTNNHGPFSTDNLGANYDYPEATYERRREILKQHEVYQKGLMYFLANDERIPEEVRAAVAKWGLPKDEFKDNGG